LSDRGAEGQTDDVSSVHAVAVQHRRRVVSGRDGATERGDEDSEVWL
jgi:hypothetical protein